MSGISFWLYRRWRDRRNSITFLDVGFSGVRSVVVFAPLTLKPSFVMLSDGKLTTGVLNISPTLLCIKGDRYIMRMSCFLDVGGVIFRNISVLVTTEGNVEICAIDIVS